MKRLFHGCVLLALLVSTTQVRALMPGADSVSFNWNYAQYGVGCAIVNVAGNSNGFENPNGGWGVSMGQSVTLRPNVAYNCSISWSGIQSYRVQFPSPSGYQVCVDGTAIDTAAGNVSGEATRYFNIVLRPVGWACQGDAAYPGTFTGVTLGKTVGWGISMGLLRNGDPIGHLGFSELDFTNSPYSRDRLIMAVPNNVGQVWVWPDANCTTIHQVMAPKILVDADDDPGGNGYWMRIYTSAGWVLDTSSWPFKYIADPNAPVQPVLLKTFRVENPNSTGKVKITETEGNSIRVWLLELSSGTVASGNYEWTLKEGGNNNGDPESIAYLRTTTATSTNLEGGVREEVQEVKDNSQVTALKTKFHYVMQPWGEEPTAITADFGGTNARTTSYTYYTNSGAPGSYGRVQSITQPSGNWVSYIYFEDWERAGRIEYEMGPWMDSPGDPSGAAPSVGRVVFHDYWYDWLGRRIIPFDWQTKIGGQLVSHTVRVPNNELSAMNNGQPREGRYVSSYSDGTNYLSSVVHSIRADANPDYVGRPTVSQNADGTQQSFQQYYGSYDPANRAFIVWGNSDYWREITLNGCVNYVSGADCILSYDGVDVEPIYVIPGKSTLNITIHDKGGDIVSKQTRVFTGGTSFALMSWEDFSYDALGRLTQRVAGNGATTTNTYANGRLASTVDPAGTETDYTYDELGRVYTMTKKGVAASGSYAAQADIVTTNTYDAAGRVTQAQTTGGSLTLTSSATYDNGGWLTGSTAPGSFTTSYAYSNGGRIQTVTNPGGATRVSETYLDGQQKQITGTAVVNETFSYGVDSGTGQILCQHRFSSWDSQAWKNSYTDWLGRPTQQWQPGWNGNATSQQWFYNSGGQLWKHTRTGLSDTLYTYDEFGRLSLEGLDINGNGQLDLASDDRITQHTAQFVSWDSWSTIWSQAATYTYATSASGAPTLTGVTYGRMNGFASGLQQDTYVCDIYGNNTHNYIIVDRANKVVTAESDLPDSNIDATQTSHNGLLVAATDAVGISTGYGYDALGRKLTETDPRKGTTTTAYKTGSSLVDWVRDPANLTQATYTYDSAGRVATLTDGAGKVTRYEYNGRGQIVHQWGNAASPVEYVYDGYGKQTEMHTFRGGSGWNGTDWPTATAGTADVTAWTYHDPTGLMQSKTDASNHSVTFTYTQARQVYQRTWARGVVTTYGYSTAGELTSVSYSDGTPSLSYSYNRLGQLATAYDSTGQRSFTYNLTGTLELQREDLPAYYGSRRLTYTYDTTGAGTKGRLTAYGLGNSGNPTADQFGGYSYRSDGRVDSFQGAASGYSAYSFSYGYGTNSHLITSVTQSAVGYADTRTFDPCHDWIDNRQTTVGGTTKAQFAYLQDNVGRVTSVTKTGELFNRYGNTTQGLATSYGYSDRSELNSEQTVLGGTSTVLTGRDDAYQYDNFGNRSDTAGTTHNGNAASYTTNNLNQYTARSVPGVFDVAGAAASGATVTVNGQSTTRHGDYFFKGYALNNNPNAVYTTLSIFDGTNTTNLPALLQGTPESMTYDEDGNLTYDGKWYYTYDGENRLWGVSTAPAAYNFGAPIVGWRFYYDYLGRRICKYAYQYDGTIWQFTGQQRALYLGWNQIAELDGNPNVTKNFFWGLDLSGTTDGAGGVGGLLLVQDGGQSYLPIYDAMGNVHGMIKAADGSLAAAYEYDGFGNTLRASGPYADSNPFRFSTKYTDKETSLVYYGNRYYHPSLGRFINRDPSEETGGLNLYGFCANNPTNAIDPLGLRTQDEVDALYGSYRSAWEARYNGDAGLAHMMFSQWEATGGYDLSIRGTPDWVTMLISQMRGNCINGSTTVDSNMYGNSGGMGACQFMGDPTIKGGDDDPPPQPRNVTVNGNEYTVYPDGTIVRHKDGGDYTLCRTSDGAVTCVGPLVSGWGDGPNSLVDRGSGTACISDLSGVRGKPTSGKGDVVGPNLNLYGPGSLDEKIHHPGGIYAISAEGSISTLTLGPPGGKVIWPGDLAVALQTNRNLCYNGEPILLCACDTGGSMPGIVCFAQRLANQVGVTVYAPNAKIWIDPGGNVYVSPTRPQSDGNGGFVQPANNPGRFVPYTPQRGSGGGT